ncbi:MAG: NAD(P)-dependent malic enzyme [Syntrophothermus sp.]
MTLKEEALVLHKKNQGKITVCGKVAVEKARDLSLAYSPGVAEPCREIHTDLEKVYDYTAKGNMVAVVSNGTAVLGLGDIGAHAALPVMEGKALLFKSFAGVDAFPICLDTKDPAEVIRTVKYLAPAFGGINLEDISAPSCFEIEDTLKKELDIPVFHDDQHGTAVVTMAGLLNALKLTGRKLSGIKVVFNGAGAAGLACARLLLAAGVKEITVCDREGAIYEGRSRGMNPAKEAIARVTNPGKLKGGLGDVIKGADVFIGVSTANVLTKAMVASMAKDPIIFAMANPDPEIWPDEAKAAGAKVVGTGRSDYPNQINNVLGFPGIFRGALDVRAREINQAMVVAAAHALADLVPENELNADYCIPNPFDRRVAPAVAAAVARAALETGVARRRMEPEEVARRTMELTSAGEAGK